MNTSLVTAAAVHRCCSLFLFNVSTVVLVLEAEVRRQRVRQPLAGFQLPQTTLVLYLGLPLFPRQCEDHPSKKKNGSL